MNNLKFKNNSNNYLFNCKTWALHCYIILVMMKWQKTKKKQKQKKGLHLRTLLFLDIYRIQILQNIAQLSSKGGFNQSSFFLILWKFGSN